MSNEVEAQIVFRGKVDKSVDRSARAAQGALRKTGNQAARDTEKAAKASRHHAGALNTTAKAQHRLDSTTRSSLSGMAGAVSRTRRWARETRKLGSSLGRTVRQVERARVAYRRYAREQAKVRTEGGKGGFDAVGAAKAYASGRAVQAGWQSGLNFNAAQARLGTVINSDDAQKDMEAARDQALAFARKSSASSTEILDIQYALNSAGFEASAARAGSEVVHKVSKVTSGSSEQVAEVIATAYNNLGHTLEGTSAERLNKIGDMMAKTQFKYQIRNFGQLGESFAEAAPAIDRFKVRMSDALALLGELNNAGQDGSKAGTSFTATFRQMTRASEELGIQIVRDQDGYLDTIATFKNLKTALDEITDIDERNDVIQQIFGDEGAKGITPMLNKIAAIQEGMRDIDGSSGVVSDAYNKMHDNWSIQWKDFLKNLGETGTTLMNSIGPGLSVLFSSLNGVVTTVNELIDSFPALGTAITVAGGAFAAWQGYKTLKNIGGLFRGVRNFSGVALADCSVGPEAPHRLSLPTGRVEAVPAAMTAMVVAGVVAAERSDGSAANSVASGRSAAGLAVSELVVSTDCSERLPCRLRQL